MTHLDSKSKKMLLNKFNLNGNIKICCVKFGYSDIKENYKNRSKSIQNFKYKQKFYTNLALEAKIRIISIFKDFLLQNRLCIENISFEADNDLVRDINTN
jgi:hypothetical protein